MRKSSFGFATKFTVILLIVFVFSSCGTKPKDKESNIDLSTLQKYDFKNPAVSIYVPKEWSVFQKRDSLVMYVVDASNNPYSNGRLLIEISVEQPSASSLEEDFANQLLAIKSRPSTTVFRTGGSVISGINAKWAYYSFKDEFLFRYFMLRNNIPYVIGCSIVERGIRYPENFDKIINKITIR